MEKMIETAVIWALPLLLAITLHEAAHAYVARFLGDSTAYLAGRLTLDPLKHIDMLGTIIIPVALLLVGSPFIFGYAKPVPVDFGQLRHPRRDAALVAPRICSWHFSGVLSKSGLSQGMCMPYSCIRWQMLVSSSIWCCSRSIFSHCHLWTEAA